MFHHNASNDSAEFDDRSDNKGPEPEALTIGTVGERTYAFIGAERVGGIFVYDVTDPQNAKFETYVNNRDFSTDEFADAGDLGPEGFAFVDKKDSPNGEYLLLVGNEVSGTTTVYSVEDLLASDEDDDDSSDNDNNDGNDGEVKGDDAAKLASSYSSRGFLTGSLISIIAGVAVAAGVMTNPAIRDFVLGAVPAELRAQLEKFL